MNYRVQNLVLFLTVVVIILIFSYIGWLIYRLDPFLQSRKIILCDIGRSGKRERIHYIKKLHCLWIWYFTGIKLK